MSLIRRRSLIQTPGVATRSSPVEGRRKTWNSWKAPKISPEEEAKWAVTPKGITPANRLATLSVAEESRSTTSLRAQTPGEMDYSHLGSLKLGTLSIVNGAPSPSYSIHATKQKSRYGGEVDYFTATEAGSSPLVMKSTRRRGHVKSKSSVLPATTPFHNNVGAPETHCDRLVTDNSPPTSQKIRSFEPQPAQEPVRSLRITNKPENSNDHDARKYAQDYQADIPKSPFASTVEFTRVETEDGLTAGTVDSYKEEAAKILAGTIFDAPTTAIETSGSVLFSAAPSISIPEKHASRLGQRPAPRTADSGYSSGGSLRVGSHSRHSTSPTSLLKPSKEGANEKQTASQVPEAHQDLLSLKTSRSERPSTSDSILSPKSPCSVASKSSFDSTGSTTQKRLQRRRPSQPELPVVQSCQSIPEGSSTIPDIPNNVRAKFTRRLSNTPGIECLTHTYPSKDHVITAEPVVDTSIATAEVVAQLTEIEPQEASRLPTDGRKRSLSLFRRRSMAKSTATDKEDANAAFGIVDLGTIASSLGSSPYDAAMSKPQRKTVTSPTHPHQLGGALPRSKSMVSMDSQAAAEFARMRSKDIALAEQEISPQRRRSYHNLKTEVGEAKASKRRPHKSLHDIPPVPAIDTTKFKVQQVVRPQMAGEIEKKTSTLSFSARSQTKGQVVPYLVDKYDEYGRSVPSQSVDWDAYTRHWSQRRKSIGEGLRTRESFGEASASTVNSRNQPRPHKNTAAWDRYSGGLDYNYEGRGVGVGGSAGTRSVHSAATPKSMQWRHQYGVDLSDVPIMLQRV